MSMTINPSAGAGGMMLQLQRLQQNMRTLQAASRQNPAADAAQSFEGVSRAPDTPQAQQAQEQSAATQAGSFGEMLREAFEGVNTLQNKAHDEETRFDMGDRSLTLADVMLTAQKARLSFEATVQVRNKLVEAYRTISQMQI